MKLRELLSKKSVQALVIGVLFILSGFIIGRIPDDKSSLLPIFSIAPTPFTSTEPEESLGIAKKEMFSVVKVIDGDTIQVSISGKTETIRLIGIDSPETVDPRKTVQCFGKEASQKAKETLSNKKVFLENDQTQGERDKYNRLLRYVFLEDGTNFNEMMISQGYAHEYTYQSNPYKYQLEFKQAEREAREQKRGLWADDACLVQPSQVQSQIKGTVNYTCDCSKLCSQIISCDEAYFQLNQCGCTKRDSDSDGVPCESLCK